MDVKRKMYRRQLTAAKPLSLQAQDMRTFLADLEPPSPTKFSQDMESLRVSLWWNT